MRSSSKFKWPGRAPLPLPARTARPDPPRHPSPRGPPPALCHPAARRYDLHGLDVLERIWDNSAGGE